MLSLQSHRRLLSMAPRLLISSSNGYTPRRYFSADRSDLSDLAEAGQFLQGRVKFYDRKKYYGFVQPEKSPRHDVFFHRQDFVTNLPFQAFPENPMVFKGETIRFRLEFEEEGRAVAREITQADGTPLPPIKNGYLKNRIREAHLILGRQVHHAMVQDITQEERWKLIETSYNELLERIARYHSIIQRVGMRVEDFEVDPLDLKEPDQVRKEATTKKEIQEKYLEIQQMVSPDPEEKEEKEEEP